MSDSVNLSTFPSTRTEGLTMLYLQNQDLSGMTPEQLVDKYEDIYARIKQRFTDNRHNRFKDN
ncbi:MAG: hypothetical protein E7263_05980 [Lachnospiraceae bacterium]|nr:hypothetical protein [Lachnospiraceae bacterium]